MVVGVSGGADSCALLLSLAETGRFPLSVAHFQHGLHPGEEGDYLFVKALAERLGLSCALGRGEVRERRHREGLSLEEAARAERFRFLEDLRCSLGAEWIVLGHTADDQVETILLRLLRGAGLSGLKGITLCDQERRVLHPLLSHWRRETVQYCQRRGLEPRQDPSNSDLAIPRNFLREEVLPLLERRFPGCKQAMVRSSDILAGEEEYLLGQSRQVVRSFCRQEGEDVRLADGIRGLPTALARRVLLNALQECKGETSFQEEEAVRLLLTGETGRSADLKGGWRALRSGDGVVLTRKKPVSLSPNAFQAPLQIPGRTVLPDSRMVLAGWIPCREIHLGGPGSILRPEAASGSLRFWQPGDRFQPLGFPHERKLQDFFTDRKVPRLVRRRVPLLICEEEVACLVGMAVSERWKLEEHHVQALYLRIEEKEEDDA
ncbi:MAG: tRNA lysidine(34) synthetase TilS [Coprothermobacterota bacterium]|nr:tRNA lysidine(34) synthetase TilS [Coprothermobacterota bacterium]